MKKIQTVAKMSVYKSSTITCIYFPVKDRLKETEKDTERHTHRERLSSLMEQRETPDTASKVSKKL